MSKEGLGPSFNSTGSWPEDFADENGNYQRTCTTCGTIFYGHKHRVTCKLCAAPFAPDAAKDLTREQAKLIDDNLNALITPSAPDVVRAIVEEMRVSANNRHKMYGFLLSDIEAAALITAHVAKETAALKKELDWVRSCSEAHSAQMKTKDAQITALTAKVERMREVIETAEHDMADLGASSEGDYDYIGVINLATILRRQLSAALIVTRRSNETDQKMD